MISRARKILWKMQKIKFSIYICFFSFFSVFAESYTGYSPKSEVNEASQNPQIWESQAEEIDSVNVQVLDKISGKVFRTEVKLNQQIQFETLTIQLKRCFRNSPDDSSEIYAYLIIKEGERVWFSGWLFASAPAVNLFEHSVYDVRVEFPKGKS